MQKNVPNTWAYAHNPLDRQNTLLDPITQSYMSELHMYAFLKT